MKKIVLAILVLVVVFGLASCNNGTTSSSGGDAETLIGKWYVGTNNGSYLEFLSDGTFNNYHTPTDSMAIGEYTYTIDGDVYTIAIENIMWGDLGPFSTTLRATIDGEWLSVSRDSTGWSVNAYIGGWHR